MRIIARLDVKTERLVKGIQFDGLRSFGPPEDYARYYESEGADELLFMDAVASLYGRNSLLEIIARVSREVFIPLTVGGGLRSLSDIEKVLGAGADKVAINTAAITKPQLISDAANRFGSSTIVVSIEAKRTRDSSYQAFINNGREPTGLHVFDWVREAQERGAGEILITSVDRDGTGEGFDLKLTNGIASWVRIPVIVSGGAGNIEHVREVAQVDQIDGIVLGSLLHYEAVQQLKKNDAAPKHSRIRPARIAEIRGSLRLKSRHTSDVSRLKASKIKREIGIIACGTCNLANVRQAADAVGLHTRNVEDCDNLQGLDGLIMPGVGAFADTMRVLRKTRLDRAIVEWIEADRPFMGICLGMQLLFSASEEFGGARGLDVFQGRVLPLRSKMGAAAKSPHMKWNTIVPARPWEHTALQRQSGESSLYFMHSYYVEPADRDLVLSHTILGELKFCSAIQRGNVFACQFHPERSGSNGLRVFREFADIVAKVNQNKSRDAHALCHV